MLWVALAGLAVAAIVTQRAQTRGRPWSVAKIGTALVVVGALVALVWCAHAAAIAVNAVVTARNPAPVDPIGQALALISGVGVFAGLATSSWPHVAGWAQIVWLTVATRALWRRAMRSAPEVALRSLGRVTLDRRATLYRRWVEIEDSLRLGRLALTSTERIRIERMERLFMPASPPERNSTAGSTNA